MYVIFYTCVSYLHGSVVERYEGGEEVQVARGEDQGKQDLAFSRDAWNNTVCQ